MYRVNAGRREKAVDTVALSIRVMNERNTLILCDYSSSTILRLL